MDATAVYDAVATQDTVTQLRAAIRKTLSALDNAGSPLAAAVRAVLRRDDEYAGPGKPPCDWDDPVAREVLVDELVRDALAAVAALDGQVLPQARATPRTCWPWSPARTSRPEATGVPDRPQDRGRPGDLHSRHCRPARAQIPEPPVRRVQGAPVGHPDSELIEEVTATAANAPDREAVSGLLHEHAGRDDKPEVIGDSAYGDAATAPAWKSRDSRSWPSARRPATAAAGSPRTSSPSTRGQAP